MTLTTRGVFWVTRAKENMAYTVTLDKDPRHPTILKDQLIALDGVKTQNDYNGIVRLVTARVLVKGQLKQTLQLSSFLGHSKQAIRWQIWTALLTYLLLRYLAFLSRWTASFSRLFTLLKGVLFSKFDMLSVLNRYGTANTQDHPPPPAFQPYLPGFVF